jgi:ferric enterobactin receptor
LAKPTLVRYSFALPLETFILVGIYFMQVFHSFVVFFARCAPAFFLVLCFYTATAQRQAIIAGTVIDSLSSKPLPYATISIFSANEKKLITGNVTDESGKFQIPAPPNNYFAEISFIGYQTIKTRIFLAQSGDTYNLGEIRIAPSEEVLDEVTISGQRSSMELTLDKKVFNVGQDIANRGGTASDVLMNIPSVAVDPEGNVQLRGSGNVRILIDGKPSGLVSFKGGAGLQQLQANMVERVEVITNPSARYEAEGMAGIINIVLKKEQREGFNGTVDAIAGNPSNYGLAANINYRHRKVNFFLNYGIAYRSQPGRSALYQEVYDNDTTFLLEQKNRTEYDALNNNIRGGIDIFLNPTNTLTGSYFYRGLNSTRHSELNYRDYANTLDNLLSTTTRTQDETETEPNSEYSIVYKKLLKKEGEELVSEIKFLDNKENSDQNFVQRNYAPDGSENTGEERTQKSINVESEKQYLLQVDYVKPFNKTGKAEIGVRSSLRKMVNDFWVKELADDGNYYVVNGLDNVFYYDEQIHAFYGILANKIGRFSYQAGIRNEWTNVETILEETNEKNPRKYFNAFPSGHLTFDLGEQSDLQASYSRRIRRPTYNDLSPFFTYFDSRNYSEGNPNLDPEYSDVFEIGYIRNLSIGSITSSIYNRRTTDKIDRIRTVDEDGNAITRPENLSSEYAYGFELTGTFEVARWWKLDANMNFFYSEIDGSNIVSTYSNTTYSWFSRQTSRFSLPGKVELQLRSNYEAPQKTAQGSRKGLFYIDFSGSKDIFKGKGTLSFSVLDLFNSRIVRSVAEGELFYSEIESQFRRRQVNVTMSYRINKNKTAKRQQRDATLEE